MIDFSSDPVIGTIVMLDDQAFTLVGTEAYTRKDGKETSLLVWQAQCAECGEEFLGKSPLVTSGLTRRCITHSKAGIPVSGKSGRGAKVTVRIIEPSA